MMRRATLTTPTALHLSTELRAQVGTPSNVQRWRSLDGTMFIADGESLTIDASCSANLAEALLIASTIAAGWASALIERGRLQEVK